MLEKFSGGAVQESALGSLAWKKLPVALGQQQVHFGLGNVLRSNGHSNARIKLTSALSPPFVNARVRFLAPLPGEGGIVGIPFGAAAVVGGRIVRI